MEDENSASFEIVSLSNVYRRKHRVPAPHDNSGEKRGQGRKKENQEPRRPKPREDKMISQSVVAKVEFGANISHVKDA